MYPRRYDPISDTASGAPPIAILRCLALKHISKTNVCGDDAEHEYAYEPAPSTLRPIALLRLHSPLQIDRSATGERREREAHADRVGSTTIADGIQHDRRSFCQSCWK